MQDKVQQKQNDILPPAKRKQVLDKVRQKQNDALPPTPTEAGAEGERKLDKVQQKQNDTLPPTEAEAAAEVEQVLDKVRQKQNDTLRHTPAEGEQDGWAAVFSPVMALGGFFSSMVSPVPPQEELSPKEPSNPLPSLLTKSSSRFHSVSSDVRVCRPQTPPQRKDSESCKETSSSLLNLNYLDAKPSPSQTPPKSKRKDAKKISTTCREGGGGEGGKSPGEPQQSYEVSVETVGRVQKDLSAEEPSHLASLVSSVPVPSRMKEPSPEEEPSGLPFPVVEVETVLNRDVYNQILDRDRESYESIFKPTWTARGAV
jgi:hypothetical protein